MIGNWNSYQVNALAASVAKVAREWELEITELDTVDIAFDILARADIEIND